MKKPKILVVDDSEIVLTMAREALEEGGFEVVTATSAMAADKYIFATDRPDLIILDVMLPTLDGDRKAKMLKDNEESSDIPILLISSKPENKLMGLVIDSGADGFIRKPFGKEQMIDTVRLALQQKKARKA